MKAFVVDKYKKNGVVRLATMPEPQLKDQDVLVQVQAAGVNLLDSKIRDGEFKLFLPYAPPFVLGHDVAGTIVQTGPKVRHFKVGDHVYARVRDNRIGTFAELIAIDEADIALCPQNISLSDAASIPLVGLTVWQALVEIGNLKRGQKVLIQAGSGGVGTFAIQLAKHLGATVATTTSAANIALVKRLGADIAIDYKTQDFEKILSGYDLVLHSQDPKTLEKSLRVLKRGGQLVSISGPPDLAFGKAFDLNPFLKLLIRLLSRRVRKMAAQLGVGYTFLFMRADGRQLQEITALIEAGAIRPVVDKVYAFEKTPEALAYVETGRARGKVVITVSA